MNHDLQRLLSNLDDAQTEIIAGIAVRIATAKSEKWTGQITFVVNVGQGGFGDMSVNRNEVVRVQKKRTVRSGGL